MNMNKDALTVIQPESSWGKRDFKELREYRDLFLFLSWRDIKAMYAQTILGFLWAIMKPLVQIIVFSIIFGRIAKVSSEGMPYFLFSSVAIIPWTYLSQAISDSSQSLVTGQALLGKVYFPRLIFPLTPVLSKLVDFGISMTVIICAMVYYHVAPTWNLLLFPVFFLMMIIIPLGVGLWMSSLAIRYRDVKYAMPFVIQMLMYTAPIVYSASSIPERYRAVYSLNPLVGVIEGYRACLLGIPIPWPYILPGIVTAVILLVTGFYYFKRMERIIVDVI